MADVVSTVASYLLSRRVSCSVAASVRVLHTSDGELAALVRSPFAAELLSDPDGLLVLSAPDGSAPDSSGTDSSGTAAMVEGLSSLPCVVVAVGRSAGTAPAWADVAPEEGVGSVDDIAAAVERNPIAATTLVLCLREGSPSLGRALVAESAAYSVLQAGTEFKGWRTKRPTREIRPDVGPPVKVVRQGDRLQLVLNRPHVRNALSRALRDGLLEGLALAEADPSLTQVSLYGEGPSFCSGGDLDEFGTFPDPAAAHVVRLATSIGRSMAGLGPRLVVHVHGPCAGSGVELPAFAARVVAHRSFTAALPEISLGLIPGAGGTASITRRVGRHRMALLALAGRPIDATTTLRWGLVDELTDERPG